MEDSTISLSPYSRIDFGKIYTINVNSRVRTIGRISPSYLGLLEEYFRSGIGVNEPDEEHDFGRTTYVSPPTFIDSSSTFSGPHRVKDNDSKNSPPPIFKNSTSTYPAPHIFEHTSLPTISKAIPQVGLTEEIKKTEDNEANKGDIPSRTTHEPISTPVIPTRPALYSPDLGGRAMSATMKSMLGPHRRQFRLHGLDINPATDLTDLDDSASDDEEFNGQKTLGDDKGILDSRTGLFRSQGYWLTKSRLPNYKKSQAILQARDSFHGPLERTKGFG
jgi:hypothetical protein